MKIRTFLTVYISFISLALFAQTTKIYGVMTDKTTNEPLIGATLSIEGTGSGTVTDLDGLYELEMTAGKYNLVASYTGYAEEKVLDFEIKEKESIKLDFALGTETEVLQTVTVTATAKRNSYANLLLIQQKSTSVVTGISAAQMRLSPDRNTADVLKRVSGASVQENKFVVIRGLSDRYNGALINGLSLPSTEPDKRAFSYDIFPSNLLDNLIIYKTATPDLPGEWAGGIVQLNTKEIPQEPFASFTVSTGYNSQSTFKGYQTYQGGDSDWLGFDDGTRALPDEVKDITLEDFNNSGLENQTRYSQSFPNDWAPISESSMRPSLGMQFSAGRSFGNFGLVGALTYSNTPRIQTGERGDFDGDGRRYQYFDTVTRDNVALGGLVNMAYKLAKRSKIQWNNTYTVTSDDQYLQRAGDDQAEDRYTRSNAYFYTANKLLTSQLLGDHALTNRQIKVNWGLGYNKIEREVPSYRRMQYNTPSYEEDTLYFAQVPFGNPSPNFAGNFFSEQTEDFLTGKLDITVPYLLGSKKGSIKTGGLWENKERSFDARLFGFISSFRAMQDGLTLLPIDKIFDPKNISSNGFLIKESTDKSDSYDAASTLYAGYGMLEQSLTERLRLIGGARVESFHQEMNSFKIKSETPVVVDTTYVHLMPSAHFIYGLSDSTNLRASISRTTSRPNFREIAPFSFFDFFLDAGINGNPSLIPTLVWNYDLRYETYRKGSQYLAASVFYKKFSDPIELIFNNTQGAGTRNFDYENVPSATLFGAEIEGRLKLTRLGKVFNDFTLFGNLSYINSEVDLSEELKSKEVQEHPLFGQSPYIANLGLTYDNPDIGFGATLLFNRYGRRVWLVGRSIYLNTYEAPRSVLDFQLTKKVNKFGELKLTFGDLLNQEAVFYQDMDDNGKFDAATDRKIVGQKFGTNVTLGFSYTLSRE
jgi:outer membrane receptor protein involved in Fe transport